MELIDEVETCPLCGGIITIDNTCSDCPHTVHEWVAVDMLALLDDMLGKAYAWQAWRPNDEIFNRLVEQVEKLATKVGLE